MSGGGGLGRRLPCPVPGCTKVFHDTWGGWDGHAGSVAVHPGWHPEFTDHLDGKDRFRDEFPKSFSATGEEDDPRHRRPVAERADR